MDIGEILIWESTNALLLIPVIIGLVMRVPVDTRAARFHGKGLALVWGWVLHVSMETSWKQGRVGR